jgi:hypothetical protein
MIFDKLWKIVVSVAVAMMLIGVVTYFVTRETKRELTPLMHALAQKVTGDFAQELPRSREVNTALFLVAGRGPRDEEDQFRQMLEDTVQATSKYRLESWERINDQLGETLVGRFLQETGLAPGEPPRTLDQASRVVHRLGDAGFSIDGILFVDIVEFTEGPDQDGLGAKISLDGRLYSVKEKKIVTEPTKVSEAIESSLDPRYVGYKISQQSIIVRFLGWFVLSAGLPWAGIALIRAILKRRRNELNGALLVTLTLADLAIFWLLVLALGTSGGAIAGLLLTAALMGYYNYDAMDYIGRRLM